LVYLLYEQNIMYQKKVVKHSEGVAIIIFS